VQSPKSRGRGSSSLRDVCIARIMCYSCVLQAARSRSYENISILCVRLGHLTRRSLVSAAQRRGCTDAKHHPRRWGTVRAGGPHLQPFKEYTPQPIRRVPHFSRFVPEVGLSWSLVADSGGNALLPFRSAQRSEKVLWRRRSRNVYTGNFLTHVSSRLQEDTCAFVEWSGFLHLRGLRAL